MRAEREELAPGAMPASIVAFSAPLDGDSLKEYYNRTVATARRASKPRVKMVRDHHRAAKPNRG